MTTTNTNELATIDLPILDDVTGAGGRFDYMMQEKQNPMKGGPFTCHINTGEVAAWAGGSAIASAKGGPWSALLGGVGGAVGDLSSQIANGACHATKKK